MKQLNLAPIWLWIFFALPGMSYSQNFPTTLEARFQTILDSLRLQNDIQGIAASVFYPDQGFWKGAGGFSQGAVPIVPDMKFGIASNSKLFTAVALLQLQEAEGLSLDDTLGQWLAPMPNIAPHITIRQLLNHTSGVFDINNIAGYGDSILADPNRVFQPEEVVGWVEAPLFAPGAGSSYSNTNYLLAGLVFEAVTNLDIEPFLRANLFIPNGLNGTFFPLADPFPTDVARPWQNNQPIGNMPRTSLLSAAWTAGAMYSTAEDLNRWYQKLFGGALLSPASMGELLSFTGATNYGLGVQQMAIGGRTCYAHGGIIRGYRSFVLFDVASGAVVSVLCNETSAPAPTVAEALLGAVAAAFTGVSVAAPSTVEKGTAYPNPASDAVWFDVPANARQASLSAGHTLQVTVQDVQGKRLQTADCTQFPCRLERLSLPAGLYFYTVGSEKTGVWYSGKMIFR
jgi:D-alanyl-D-alanine carboxypeptidase